jgi:SEC-C motif
MSFEVAQERRKQTGRNDVCPCGSGIKYKKCHQQEDDAVVAAELKRRAEAAIAEAEAKAAEAEEAGEGKPDAKSDEARGRAAARGGAAPKRGGARPTAVGKAQNLPRRGAV